MFSDTTSIVRVTQFFKTIGGRDPVSNVPATYDVPLDWGIGAVDSNGLGVYTYGSPYQLFTTTGQGGIYGDPTADGRVLMQREQMALSSLPGPQAALPTDIVHFKNPGI